MPMVPTKHIIGILTTQEAMVAHVVMKIVVKINTTQTQEIQVISTKK